MCKVDDEMFLKQFVSQTESCYLTYMIDDIFKTKANIYYLHMIDDEIF